MDQQTHLTDERGSTMGASYWARWACNGRTDDLPNLLLPCVLAEGYDLLACDDHRQVFDRGGVMRKIAWSLNGGRWSDAPVDLTVTYSFSPSRTVANFYWRLAVRPCPTTQKEQASFEAWVREQLDRIIASLGEKVEQTGLETADEGLNAPAPGDGHDTAFTYDQIVGLDTAVRTNRVRSSIQYASTYVEAPPKCDRCWKPAVAIPGTTGRYYCLTCRRHLPKRTGIKNV